MNTINLIGRLTRDPEHRVTENGTDLCKLRLAVPRRKVNGEDAGAVFITVVAFAGLARSTSEYLTRGREVGITGRLEYSEWTADNGSKRSTHEVIAEDVQFLDRPRLEEPLAS
jgi:single-strand DNA-binding protein